MSHKIVLADGAEFHKIWDDRQKFIFKSEKNPFGDGKASEKILKTLLQ